VAVGDASGHRLPAALLVRDVVTGLRMGVEKEMKMAEAMRKLNRVIHRSTLSANFVSLCFAQIESTGNVFYVLSWRSEANPDGRTMLRLWS
jgi:serine phosphatase RsbU (regulator of sigma subunit)